MRRFLLSLVALVLLALPAQAFTLDRDCEFVQGSVTTSNGFAGCDQELVELYKRAAVIFTVGGTGNAITGTTTPALTALFNGQTFIYRATASNSGATTLTFPSLTGKPVVTNAGAALAGGELLNGSSYLFYFDLAGDHFRIVGSPSVGGGGGDSMEVEDGDNAGTFTAIATTGRFEDSGDLNFVNTANDISALVRADSVALTTDTTGNYAAGDAEAGAALTGDSATAFFTLGALEMARGGTGDGAAASDDQALVSDSTSASTWRTLPDSEAAGVILGYDVTTNAFSTKTDDDIPDAGDYTNLSATSPITQSAGTISTSIATNRLVGRTTAGTGVMEQITPDATLSFAALGLGVIDVTCTGCLGTTEIAALDTADVTTGTFADARIDGSLENDELVLAGDVDGTASANDIDEANVEAELEGVVDLPDLQGILTVAKGGNGAAPGADDQTVVSSSTSAAAWVAIPDSEAAGTILGYDITTNVFSTKADDDVPEAGDLGVTTPDVQTMTATGSGDSWDKPTGAQTMCYVQLWAGGGSGGKGAAAAAAAGGGGGAYKEKFYKMSDLGATETVSIAAGGAAQTSASTDGIVGGNTTFGAAATLLTAHGGGGGDLGATGGGGGGGGGARAAGGAGATITGGTSDAIPGTVGNLTVGPYGTPGGNGIATGNAVTPIAQFMGGAGGGGSTGDATGTNAPGGSNEWGGAGGGAAAEDAAPGPGAGGVSQYGGNGGAGAFDASNATAGVQPAGGGGGAETGNSGKGGDGKAVITCF